MVVQHNLTAMNANRMLNLTRKAQSGLTEKLSSGYRINRAADDAAGLSISEKMRKQIRGLKQASLNAQDGISMVQVADGAMAEVSDMLQRINELAVKSANGTLSTDDREYIQNEVDQLLSEIDRVGDTTKFNELYVLKDNCTVEYKEGFIGKLPDAVMAPAIETFNAGYYNNDVTFSGEYFKEAALGTHAGNNFSGKGFYLDFGGLDNGTVKLDELYGTGFSATCLGCNGYVSVEFTDDPIGSSTYPSDATTIKSGNSWCDHTTLHIGIGGATSASEVVRAIVIAAGGDPDNHKTGNPGLHETNGSTGHNINFGVADGDSKKLVVFEYRGNSSSQMASAISAYNTAKAATPEGEVVRSQGAVNSGYYGHFYDEKHPETYCNLHVGADATSENAISVKLPSISTKLLGFSKMDILTGEWSHTSVDTQDKALTAINTVSTAIKYVSTERSRMGAYQNRLEHTINNLDNVVENTTAAESQIRDTDIARMMVEFAKNNILLQAGQAMLAQANQTNQGVLALLG